jgi:hypothetical protein
VSSWRTPYVIFLKRLFSFDHFSVFSCWSGTGNKREQRKWPHPLIKHSPPGAAGPCACALGLCPHSLPIPCLVADGPSGVVTVRVRCQHRTVNWGDWRSRNKIVKGRDIPVYNRFKTGHCGGPSTDRQGSLKGQLSQRQHPGLLPITNQTPPLREGNVNITRTRHIVVTITWSSLRGGVIANGRRRGQFIREQAT